MNTIKVSVTQGHIERGDKYSACTCPVALALRDVGAQYSYVVNWASLHNIYGEKVATLPAAAIGFINDFDHDYPVEPFEFYVQIDR